ncbi:MAG: cell division protein FtsQ/DivIB [Betaproteobacteria bacterium]|nr:cell division protein FtsQ/DivIB [Betaproteobacteria bacterium]
MAVISLPGWLQLGRNNRPKTDNFELLQKKKRRQSSMGTRVKPGTHKESVEKINWISLFSMLAKVVIIVAVGVALYAFVSWGIKRPMFSIQRIQVTGSLQQVDKELVSKRLQSMSGNFFTFNLSQAAKELNSMPWVSHVQLRRLWPNGIEVSVAEHHPLVRWDEQKLLDTDGQLFEADYSGYLPQYKGPEGSQAEVLREARELNRQLSPIHHHIDELALSDRRAWTIRLENGLTLNLGRANIHERLDKFVEAYPTVFGDQPGQGKLVDLRYENGFALRLAAAESGAKQ